LLDIITDGVVPVARCTVIINYIDYMLYFNMTVKYKIRSITASVNLLDIETDVVVETAGHEEK
jgi:hypothetical protein